MKPQFEVSWFCAGCCRHFSSDPLYIFHYLNRTLKSTNFIHNPNPDLNTSVKVFLRLGVWIRSCRQLLPTIRLNGLVVSCIRTRKRFSSIRTNIPGTVPCEIWTWTKPPDIFPDTPTKIPKHFFVNNSPYIFPVKNAPKMPAEHYKPWIACSVYNPIEHYATVT